MGQETMMCDDYLSDVLWHDNNFHTLISEMFWKDGVDTELMFNYMLDHAKERGIALVDSDIWDYDRPMYESYKCSDDKGLS